MPIEDRTQSLSEAFAGGIKRADALDKTMEDSENSRVEREWMNEIRSMDKSDASLSGQEKTLSAIIQSGVQRGIDPKKLQAYHKLRRMSQQAKDVMEKKGLTGAMQALAIGNTQPLEQVMANMGTHVVPGSLQGSLEEGIVYTDAADGQQRKIGPRVLGALAQQAGIKMGYDKKYGMTEYQRESQKYRKARDKKLDHDKIIELYTKAKAAHEKAESDSLSLEKTPFMSPEEFMQTYQLGGEEGGDTETIQVDEGSMSPIAAPKTPKVKQPSYPTKVMPTVPPVGPPGSTPRGPAPKAKPKNFEPKGKMADFIINSIRKGDTVEGLAKKIKARTKNNIKLEDIIKGIKAIQPYIPKESYESASDLEGWGS